MRRRHSTLGQYLLAKLLRKKKIHRYDELIRRTPPDRPCVACEVGVWKGKTSEKVLEARPNLFLYAVDKWQQPDSESAYEQSGDKKALMPQAEFDAARERAMERLAPYHDRVRILQGDSVVMAAEIEDESLDWVFLDGDHSQDSVLRDLHAYYPKVKPGGLVAGHDWAHPDYPFGVEKAVYRFLEEIKLTDTAPEVGADFTWFLIKP